MRLERTVHFSAAESLEPRSESDAQLETEATVGDGEEEEEAGQEFVFKVAVVGDYGVGKTSFLKRILDIPYEESERRCKTKNAITKGRPAAPGDAGKDGSGGISRPGGEDVHEEEEEDNGGRGSDDDQMSCETPLKPLPAAVPTIGTDFYSRVVRNAVEGTHVRLQFWDTAGLERYAAVHAATFRNASVVFAVFDVSNRDSFAHIASEHLKRAVEHNPELSPHQMFVIGNKVDLLNGMPPEDADRLVTQAELQSGLFNIFPGVRYYEVSAQSNYGVQEVLRALCVSLLMDHTDSKNNRNGKEVPAAGGTPPRSLLPLEPAAEAAGQATEADGSVAASQSLPSSPKLLSSPNADGEAGCDEFSPKEGGDELENNAASSKLSARCASDDTAATDVAEAESKPELLAAAVAVAASVTSSAIAEAAATVSRRHVDPNKGLSDAEQDGDQSSLHSRLSDPHATATETKSLKESCRGCSANRQDMDDIKSSDIPAGEATAAPPSVANTANFHSASLELNDSPSNDSCRVSSLQNYRREGRKVFEGRGRAVVDDLDEEEMEEMEGEEVSEDEEDDEETRISNKLRRINRDARMAEELRRNKVENPPPKKAEPVKLSACHCLGSKGSGC
ncbi:unnamed protein product [Trypanosoma congolense IL3000]|uniref:WGS project CAEQ00000000 data, annotated contig 437 n=1 Tax=Trypanosoma congolense (strain IL3000) TaxID=1068625 RepID=F9WFY3_TRYCI|nr:unnamed protein product [Trypanosoma congolense IL3000]